MSAELHTAPAAPLPVRTLPRAAWVGGGLLGLVGAGVAGALIMRAADAPSTASANAAPPAVAAQAVPSTDASRAKALPHAKRAAPAEGTARAGTPLGTTAAHACTNCGTVESVEAVQQKGQGTGLGAVAGGVLGGVVGHQVGGGNGKTAMTVIGAVGGGLAGHEVEKRARAVTVYKVLVRMDDGSTHVFQRAQSMAVGTHVVVDGTALRVARDGSSSDEPGLVRTNAAANGRT